jgi:hypothetical protein
VTPLDALRSINSTAYGYMSSWALLTACEQRLFDRLPSTLEGLADVYPDPDITETWLRVLEQGGFVTDLDGVWTNVDEIAAFLAGDDSYSDYLGRQVLDGLAPRLMGGAGKVNALADALRHPERRTGYDGWFADAAEARAYQESQFAGSLGPAGGISKLIPAPQGRVLDLGGGWGAIARAIAARHAVDVDVVDLGPVVSAAPPAGDRVTFIEGSALDPATWPSGVEYDGVVLSYLLSSVPGATHGPTLAALADRGVRWIAVHDFMIDRGEFAAVWSLQHAVFVPGHRSFTSGQVAGQLAGLGFGAIETVSIVDGMTAMVTGVLPA